MFGFGPYSLGSGMSSLEPQMSGLFEQMGLPPPSLKAFTTGFQPASSGSTSTNSGVENRVLSSLVTSFELPSIDSTRIEDGHDNIMKHMRLHGDQMAITTSNMNDLQVQTSHMREAGSGSSTPSVNSASSVRNSMYRASSVDSQLALLRNEMVRCVFLPLIFSRLLFTFFSNCVFTMFMIILECAFWPLKDLERHKVLALV